MNQIYRTLWSSVLGNWVVTHEHAKAHGKGGSRRAASPAGAVLNARGRGGAGAIKSLVLALFCAAVSPFALALPEGGVIRSGSGGIVSSGEIMTITQETARLSADFSRFNIAAPETVRAIQPDSASVALFRVLGNDPSAIYGKLIANGQVFLSNPNGILFGKGAQVDVGGLVATTMNIDQADFMAGRNRFHGGATGSVVNEGTINTAARGYVAMLAPEVRNDGVIVARLGTVALGAGQAATLDFAGNGKVNLQIDQGVLNGSVANRQAIIAEGGQVIMSAGVRDALLNTVVNNEGVVEARRISQEGGVIRLEGGRVNQRGTLDASGAAAADKGGEITLIGEHITLAAGSTTDASGATGGGTILIGGDYQGANPDIPNAVTTLVEASAEIRADAQVQGDGGKVIVWSDQHTGFLGHISAKGGSQGGNGGFAEVSGKEILDYRGHADLTAPLGKSGTLLLDPKNINIVATGAGAVASSNEFVENPAGTSNISGVTLAAAIDSASVILQANNNITFNDNVTATSAGNGLSLQAGRSISFGAGKQLNLNGGNFTASINDDAAQLANRGAGTAQFTMAAGSSITTNGGAIMIGGGNRDSTGAREVRLTGSALDAGSGNISITGIGRTAAASRLYGVSISGAAVKTTSGNITITGAGGAGTSSNHGVYLVASATADALVTTTSGDIDIEGTGGNGTNSNLGVYLAGNGAARKAKVQSTTGNVSVTGTGQGSGKNNRGVQVTGGGEITTGGSGAITLSGTGSTTLGATSGNYGVFLSASALAGSLVQTLGSGGVMVTGTGGQGTSSNYGVVLSGNGAAMNATLQSTSGAINVTGTGGNGSGSSNRGVVLLGGGKIASDSGKVSLKGQGGNPTAPASSNYGVHIGASATADALVTTSSGEIDIQGTGGNGTNSNFGVYLAGNGAARKAKVQSTSGNVSVTGTGQGKGTNNLGVQVAGGGEITTGGSGAITLSGTGSTTLGATSGNHGVYLSATASAGSLVQALGSGGITMTGTGGQGTSSNYGVVLSGNGAAMNATLQSASGAINVTGTGGNGSGSSNRGVVLLGGGKIASDSGKVLLKGQGGNPTAPASSNYGVHIGASATADALVTTTSGDIDIEGTGGNGTNSNLGVYLAGNGAARKAKVQSTTGNVSVTGTGQGKGTNNQGVQVAGGGEITTGGSGTIILAGTGSTTLGATSGNHGVYLSATASAGSLVRALGSGGITMTGTGGQGTSSNYGVVLSGNTVTATKATLQSASGAINVTGNGGNGSGSSNRGVGLLNGGEVVTSAGGALTVIATGANGANGFYTNGAGGNSIAGAGVVTITASGGNISNPDFRLSAGDAIIGNGAAVTINADRMFMGGSINASGQVVTLRPKTVGRGVNLGSVKDTSASALELSSAELNKITASSLVLGNTASGNLTISSSIAPIAAPALTLLSGGTVSQSASANVTATTLSASGSSLLLGNAGNAIDNLGAMTASNGDLTVRDSGAGLNIVGNVAAVGGGVTIRTLGDLRLNAGSSISANAAHNITLDNGAAGGKFINDSGPTALTVGTGRWLVYSSDPANDARNGLAYDFKQYGATYGTPVLGGGNGFLYSLTPSLTPALTGTVTKTYDGSTTAALAAGNYLSGAIDGDTVTFTGTGIYDSKDVGAGKQVSVSGISIASAVNGAATVYGYQMAATTASANIGKISQKTLTATGSSAAGKIYDGNTSAAITVGNLSGFVGTETVSASASGTFDSKNAGPRSATASYLLADGTNGGLATNYLLADSGGHSATIAKALLNISADDKTKTAGLPNPILTANYSGFVPGEGPGVLTGTLGLATTATTLSSAGDYPIKPSGVSSTNYAISYKDGTLHVDPASGGGNDVGIREIAGILAGAPIVPSGLNPVDALNALPGTAAGGEGGEVIPDQSAQPFLAGNVAVVVCGIALPPGVEADSRCQIR